MFDQVIILCHETARGISGCDVSWDAALEVLRVWEYTGRVRRGYFVSGMSGAQYIRARDFEQVTRALDQPEAEGGGDACSGSSGGYGDNACCCYGADITWLPAADPAQPWGKSLRHIDGRVFMSILGTAVALLSGIPVAVFERYGQVLRIFDHEHSDAAVVAFAREFQMRRIFPNLNRVTVKQFPDSAVNAFSKAGFSRELGDYILYRDEHR
jgi:ATP-dependent Lhr-like helicase